MTNNTNKQQGGELPQETPTQMALRLLRNDPEFRAAILDDVIAQRAASVPAEVEPDWRAIAEGRVLQICDLEAELAASVPAQAETFAWAAFAANGNVIIWSKNRQVVDEVAAKYGKTTVPVVALNVGTATPGKWSIDRDCNDRFIVSNGQKMRAIRQESEPTLYQYFSEVAAAVPAASVPAQADLIAKINALRVRGVNYENGVPARRLVDRAEVLALLGGAP